jgi:hypothetical protein
MLFEGVAGRFLQRAAGNLAARMTQLTSLPVAQVEGEGDEMSRAGLRFHMSATGATGIAPVQAIPSTAAQWLIFNPVGSQVTAFLDRIGSVNVSGTAGSGENLYACIVPIAFVPATVPTKSAANIVIQNANPVSSRTSSLIVVSGVTLQNAAVGNWWPIATGVAKDGVVLVPPVATGTCSYDDIRGKLIIPPNCGLALAVIAPTGTTPLYAPYASWREYAADLE